MEPGRQFMPLRELTKLRSADFDGQVGDITSKWLDDLPHRSEGEHAELAKQAALTSSIRKHGVQEPLLIRHWPDSAYGPAVTELANGHHRAMAAMELGLTHVPVRHITPAEDW